tara:strand:- start:23475 stop:24650 length:1176 start_codon:yes stop_codon:yes gene_type:complete
MKVLHVLYQSLPNSSGSSIRSRDIINNQLKIGLTPVVITSPFQHPFKSGEKQEYVDGIMYYRTFINKNEIVSETITGFWVQIRKFLRIFKFTIEVYKIAKKENVDIIHAHAMFFCSFSAKIASLLLNKPMLYEIRSLWEERFKKNSFKNYLIFSFITFIETFSMFLANHLITINTNLKTELKKRFFLKNKKIIIVENAVDLSNVKDLSLKKDEIVFGYVGTLSPIEGLDLLIKAFNNLKLNNKLLIFGDGIDFEKLKNLVNKNINIEFRGQILSEEIFNAYKEIDVIINPRKSSYLTNSVTPLKTLEAMAYKKLVLASDVGGMKELIEHENNGLLFTSNSVQAIENIILEVIDRNDLDRIMENAYEFIKEDRNWLKNAKIYKSIYEVLIND